MPARRRKKPGDLQGHREAKALEVEAGGAERRQPPVAPPTHVDKTPLSEEARILWQAVWAAEVSRAWDPLTDIVHVVDYVRTQDEIWELERTIRDLGAGHSDPTMGRLVKGSTGQAVLNPLYTRIKDLRKQKSWLEEHLGLTPLARTRLGLLITAGQHSLAALQKEVQELALAQSEGAAREIDGGSTTFEIPAEYLRLEDD